MSRKKTEKKSKGAVEIKEEDLDQASGGAVDMFRGTAVAQDFHLTASPTDGALNFTTEIKKI